jgi:hypothetical protein
MRDGTAHENVQLRSRTVPGGIDISDVGIL